MSNITNENSLAKYVVSFAFGHWSRVESHEMSPGIADLDYCVEGKEGHIELKFGTNKKLPEIRPTQIKWFRDRILVGGNPMILLAFKTTQKTIFGLIQGKYLPELSNLSKTNYWFDFAFKTWENEIDWEEFKNICICMEAIK